jgi:hypothetical protein
MGSERRKFVRYDIAPIPSVKAVLHDGRVPTKLGTIGMGGCGFWAEKKDDTLQMGQEVKCSISFDGILPKSIEVSGLIQYCNTAEFEGKPHFYYGIAFIGDFSEKLAPIVRHLERLERLGRVLIAAD